MMYDVAGYEPENLADLKMGDRQKSRHQRKRKNRNLDEIGKPPLDAFVNFPVEDNEHLTLPLLEDMPSTSSAGPSKSVHVQRVEAALNLRTLAQMNLSDTSSDSEDDLNDPENEELGSILKDSELYSHKDYYNFSSVSTSRKWLAEVLQENSDSDQCMSLKETLKYHKYHKKVLKDSKENLDSYMYYGAGLLSNVDKYPEVEKTRPVKEVVKKKVVPITTDTEEAWKSPTYINEVLDEISNEAGMDVNFQNVLDFQNIDDDSNINSDFGSALQIAPIMSTPSIKKKTKKFKDEEGRKKWEEVMRLKRRKVFVNIAKKEIGKVHRSKVNRHKEMLIQCKRVAQHCVKYCRQKALQSARAVKEQQWRMKRLTRELLAYMKRSRRADREIKKRMEKEAEEQRKIDHELVEAKRQQRKLNFLITQTELYAHFMSRKLGQACPEEQLRILSQLDEERTGRTPSIDDYDSEIMKEKAKRNAQEAFQNERARTQHFNPEAGSCLGEENSFVDGEHPQPELFQGTLKGYQVRGMNWLANLYSQGISGILADEMGLGKTVQSIAFLCHIVEKYSIWGPFLIISPASTLHNWQQEIGRFVPNFKVVPYWGSPNERKILRRFWDVKGICTENASFHIVITSYQIVISDIKYFNRIKWQYMILDEAQAIKSTSSNRWKTLLGFSCRNRLLLSGTPIQNSMAELWALLHFIMPTLFDSHDEFNEWFSKDIENHAENKTGIDEKHLTRLHMILKPFMLRRIKKDVENELSDKIEVMVYCPLTTRQKLLYLALKQKIRIEDLLHYSVGGGDSHNVDKNFTSNLMNLVMQFRKVCNHPELFERRDAKSPMSLASLSYVIPFLVYDFNVRLNLWLRIKMFLIFSPQYVAKALENDEQTIFKFCLNLKLSPTDIYLIFSGNILHRWKTYFESEKEDVIAYHRHLWNDKSTKKVNLRFSNCFTLSSVSIKSSDILRDIVFTRQNTSSRIVYTHIDHFYHSMPETVEHKNIRYKQLKSSSSTGPEDGIIVDVVNSDELASSVEVTTPQRRADFEYKRQVHQYEKTYIPQFLFCWMPKISSSNVNLYCYSRRVAWDLIKSKEEHSFRAFNYYWSEASGNVENPDHLTTLPQNPLDVLRRVNGWSDVAIPDKETLVTDSGKLSVLDSLLKRLKEEGHRVLIYSQMTKMIDLLEEYMWHRHHKYMRLDGSSKISERRDMVADFQARSDIFVFLLSTRAGGLGINLTAADTVIFYDSDWNPTVDQQAMDRAHRLGQTKQVTVYRLICKGSIEERILQRAREKSEIQKLVISGGDFKPDTLKPKEVVSLLLDDDELVQKCNLKIEGGKPEEKDVERKRKLPVKAAPSMLPEAKKAKEELFNERDVMWNNIIESYPNSPGSANSGDFITEDFSETGSGIGDDGDSPITNKYTVYNVFGSTVKPRNPSRGSSRRGRPRGSRRVNASGRSSNTTLTSTESISTDNSPTSSASSQVSTAILDPSMIPGTSTGTGTSYSQNYTVRRGPGRPRLKPTGPGNSGSRGSYRPRKPVRPLPVPLPSDGSTGTQDSGLASSYMYDFDVFYAKNQSDM